MVTNWISEISVETANKSWWIEKRTNSSSPTIISKSLYFKTSVITEITLLISKKIKMGIKHFLLDFWKLQPNQSRNRPPITNSDCMLDGLLNLLLHVKKNFMRLAWRYEIHIQDRRCNRLLPMKFWSTGIGNGVFQLKNYNSGNG